MTWILKGHISVASDVTTAGLISSPSTQTRAALAAVLNALVEPLVEDAAEAVSYTHLTLPTILLV